MTAKESNSSWDTFRSDARGDPTDPRAGSAAMLDVNAFNLLIGELNAKILSLEARVETLEGNQSVAANKSQSAREEAEKDFSREASAVEVKCLEDEADTKCDKPAIADCNSIQIRGTLPKEEAKVECDDVAMSEDSFLEEGVEKKCIVEAAAAEADWLEINVDTKSEEGVSNSSTNRNENISDIGAQEEMISTLNHCDVRHLLFTDSTHRFLFMEELDLGECGVYKVPPRDIFNAIMVIAWQMGAYCYIGFLITEELQRDGSGAEDASSEEDYIPPVEVWMRGWVAIFILWFFLAPDITGAFLLATCPGWRARLASGIIALEAAFAYIVGFGALKLISVKGILDGFFLCVGIAIIHDIDEKVSRVIIILASVCKLRGSRRTEHQFTVFYNALNAVLVVIGLFGVVGITRD